MKQKLLIFLLLMCSLTLAAQTSDSKAKTVVDKAVAKLQNGAFMSEIKIVFTTQSGKKNSENGTLKLYGNKFYLKTADFENFFDGKTQWAYISNVNEVTISVPTKEELKTISPVFIIKNLENNHRFEFDGNAAQDDFWNINIYPTNKKIDYFKIVLRIIKKNNEVKHIEVLQKNGEKLAITFGNYTALAPENQIFTFNAKNYPKVEINDMR